MVFEIPVSVVGTCYGSPTTSPPGKTNGRAGLRIKKIERRTGWPPFQFNGGDFHLVLMSRKARYLFARQGLDGPGFASGEAVGVEMKLYRAVAI
jgi:hypothetical protein